MPSSRQRRQWGADRRVASNLSQQVVNIINETFRDRFPSVEEVQDIVEKVPIENGHAKTAKAYILYRKQHGRIIGFQHLLLNAEKCFRNTLVGRTGVLMKTAT